MTELDCDVLVVGYGPVGQTLTILLARQGHRVVVLERQERPYPRPRAVHFDDEIARVFAAAGLGAQTAAISQPSGEYDWRNAEGRTLLHFDWGAAGPSGWPEANMFSQPQLESVLADAAGSFANVEVRRGWEAVALTDHGDHVETRARIPGGEGGERSVRARYVVGCDGANSFVRDQLGTGLTDLGFFYDWLILDVIPHEQREWKPFNLQICDPRRPTTVVSGGPGRRRWEFMRLPGETIDELNTEQTAWRLLAPWDLAPGNADLERHTVYTFQARWADRWRHGRILIAGDAAHLMPPFAGQGMCSGVRDAANLAWKLDLVLSGRAGDALLDTYTSERSAHVQNAIGMSRALGNVICLTDPAAAAARDEVMLKAEGRPELALPAIPPPILGPGILNAGADGAPIAPAGQLSPQGLVAGPDGVARRFDEVIGTGFVILSLADLSGVLTEAARASLGRLGARVVRLAEPGPAAEPGTDYVVGADHVDQADRADRADRADQVAVDVDGFYRRWLRAAGHEVIVIRPDFYIFGAAADAAQLPALLRDLLAQLGVAPELAATEPGSGG
jgi:2-polyprenyl-6-methoxyphenol hydroxylase-like FAD-dependent oxidoreductase